METVDGFVDGAIAEGSILAGVSYALMSLIFSVAGLSALHLTRPSRASAESQHLSTMFGFTYRLVGIFGGLLLFVGLVLGTMPWLLGRWSSDEGRIAHMILCLLAPCLWGVEFYLPGARRAADVSSRELLRRRFHGIGCAVVWFGSTLLEWAGARPHDSVAKGFEGQMAGCDGGYRSPFLIYISGWLTSILFGTIFLFLIGPLTGHGGAVETDRETSDDEAARHSFLGGIKQKRKSDHALRTKALPILYGFTTSMACFALALGATLDSNCWTAFGSLLLAIAVVCACQWFWYLELPLAYWAVTSQAMGTWLRNLQAHLIFRDFRWESVGMGSGRPLAMEKYPGVWIYLTGFFLVSAVCACVMAVPAHGGGHRPTDPDGRADSKGRKARNNRVIVQAVAQLEWAVFAVMLVFYYLGVSRPLMETRFELPELHYFHLGAQQQQEMVDAKSSPLLGDVAPHSGGSYMDLIPNLYDGRLPCSAMVISFNTWVRAPMQIITFLLVKTKPDFVPNVMLRNLQAIWIEHQAPGWFCNPMVLMMLISLINVTGPSGSLYHCFFGNGFWFFLTYALCSVVNAWLFVAFPESGAFASVAQAAEEDPNRRSFNLAANQTNQSMQSYPDSMQSMQSYPDFQPERQMSDDSMFSMYSLNKTGYEAMFADAEADGSRSSGSDSDDFVPVLKKGAAALGIGICVLTLAAATFLGLTQPFLDFEYRLSGVAVKRATVRLLDLLYGIGEVSDLLQWFTWATIVGSLMAWVPLFLVRLTLHSANSDSSLLTEVFRILEVSVRPWVMIDIWAFSMLLVYYIVTARNKGVIEVCATVPRTPLGLTAIFVVFCVAKGLKHLARAVMPSGITALGHYHGAGRGASLPGGNALWGAAYGVTLIYTAAFFYVHGPVASRQTHAISLYDLNRELEVLIPVANREMHREMPRTVGNCPALWEHEVAVNADPRRYEDFREQEHCRGEKPLHQAYEERMFGEASWARGVDSLEILKLRVHHPTPVTEHMRRWNMTVSGRFTNLSMWLKVDMGDGASEEEMINDYMCCQNPFHWAIEVSVTCDDNTGFGDVQFEVVHVDHIEFQHKLAIDPDPLDQTMLQVNYGSYDVVERAVRDFMTMKTGHFLLKNPDGTTTDPLDSSGDPTWTISGYLAQIVQLNTGHRCLQPGDSLLSSPDMGKPWQEPVKESFAR